MSLLSILCSMIGRNDEENMYAGIVPFWMMLEKDLVASSWTWRGAMYRYSCKSMVNPLHPNISMKILHTVLLPFLVVLLRRNFLMITSFISWLVTLMFHLVLDSSHSWGWKDWFFSSKLEFAIDFVVVIGQNGQQNGQKKWCEKYGSLSLFLWYNTYEYVWFSQIQFWKKLGSVFQIYIFDILVSSI